MQLGGGEGGRSGGPTVGGGNSCGIPRLTMDAGRVTFACIPITGLIAYAYGVRPDQIAGPDWLTDPGAQRFERSWPNCLRQCRNRRSLKCSKAC